VTQTELRLIFKKPPRLGLHLPFEHDPKADQLVVRLDPTVGVRIRLDARRGDAEGPQLIHLDAEAASQGGEGPTPYEVLLHAAMIGNSTRFARQDGVEQEWRVMQPLLDKPSEIQTYAPGSWGPTEAEALVADYGGWHGPWVDDAASTVPS
jgi:glucose-6-phosphate 1-dehydrogenase